MKNARQVQLTGVFEFSSGENRAKRGCLHGINSRPIFNWEFHAMHNKIEPRFVIKCLRAYDPIAEEIESSLLEFNVSFSREKREVSHYGKQDGHHYNDEFIIPLAQSKPLRAWLAEKISIMFGSNLELKVEKEGETTFAKGRTLEEIERLFEIAQKNKPAESKDEKKKKK